MLRNLWVRSTALFVCAVACSTWNTSYAAQADRRPSSWIEVSAEAEVEAPADIALIDVGVSTQAASAAAAARDNAKRVEAVLARLRSAGAQGAQISTGAYSLRPVYSNPRDGTEPKVLAYAASNVLHVKTPDLARVGELIDVAVQAGANQVQRIGFTLADSSIPHEAALRSAVMKARREADAAAAALGLKVARVHSAVVQDTGVVRPLMREAMVARADAVAATPIEPGFIQVRARVVLTVAIEQ
jgi:uncharacterized protein YggE